ncbi:MAG: rubredoxin [Burkholderiales bacterium]|nr:rubredoxin [Burkholderiales bacterium]MDE2158448.1 rubredoxin [Burkholderiales bacterium]
MNHPQHDTTPVGLRHGTLGPTSKLECKICWTVYDPALGDEVWQIPPGTPFSALPEHWTCPNCSAEKHNFLLLDE